MKIPRRTIINCVAKAFDVSYRDMDSKRQHNKYCHARFAAWHLIRELRPDTSLPEIGRTLGDRDHTTVMSGLRRVGMLLAIDPEFVEKLDAARQMALEWQPGEPQFVYFEPVAAPLPAEPEPAPVTLYVPPIRLKEERKPDEDAYEHRRRVTCNESEARFLELASREFPHLVRVPQREAAE
jgi:hypothetical protein